ncbi:MAG: DnaJ domain-containing protein [Alloprevotella sp.]|nr:DnaJ domain-containing protein [Alloprevotella sp.]
MASIRWIGGVLGFMAGGPLGGLLGYFIGSVIDGFVESSDVNHYSQSSTRTTYRRTGTTHYDEPQRNSFLFSFLVLTSYVIFADQKVMHSEMEYVRRYLRNQFGEGAKEQGNKILLGLFEIAKKDPLGYDQHIVDSCLQISNNMTQSQLLTLFSFLVEVAKADGHVDNDEKAALQRLSGWLGLPSETLNQMLGLGGKTLDDAYAVLGVSADATDAEVKAAYRKLALQHHPDRVASLGEDVRKAAEKKFQQINEAKEKIWAACGLK